jgi:hypothetical protein
MGARTKWPKVQDIMAWGPEQNDPRSPSVSRCSSLIFNSIYGAQSKDLKLSKGQSLEDLFAIGLGNSMVHIVLEFYIWLNTKTLSCMGARTMWLGVQDTVAWGLEQNDHMLPRVPSCT